METVEHLMLLILIADIMDCSAILCINACSDLARESGEDRGRRPSPETVFVSPELN